MSLPRYPEYRDTGVEWLGEVPSHWQVCAPKRLMSSAAGGTLIKGQCSDEPKEGLFPAFSASGQDVWVENATYSAPGLVLSAVGARCGKTFKADGQWGVVANTHCLFPGSGATRDYLWYLTNVESWWEKGGTAQPFVKVSDTLARLWVFPPISEQKVISVFLDDEIAKIDALIAEQAKLLALLAEKRQATIAHAVTRGLDPNAPLKSSGIPWLGEVPAHWEVIRVKDVARLESGHTPSKQFPEYWEDCDIPWVSLNDSKQLAANDYISETAVKINALGLANSSARMLPLGTVVFTRDATIGLSAITTVPMAVSQHLIAWCPSERILALFLLRVFNAMKDHLDSYTFGATIKTIGMGDVKTLVTPLPPLAEQEAIVRSIDLELSKLDAAASDTSIAIALLKERRSALIAAAVTGQIDVRGAVESEAA